MPTHWTYDHFGLDEDLAQGDIIEPTPELQSALQEFHSGFLDPKYVGFMVLTQSCDLVRRHAYRGQPIALCVVRELNSIARTLLKVFCGTDIQGVFRKDARSKGRMFIDRTINQNEQAIGLFYLHPDQDAGITTPSVAMLRISIALHTKHYDKLLSSRRGRLMPAFQAKLGWLVGNLYSRVGTEDWSETDERKRKKKSIVDKVLNEVTKVKWSSSEAVARAKKAGFSAEGKNPGEISKSMDSYEPKPLDQLVRDEFKRIIATKELDISPSTQASLMKRLPNDALMAELFRRMRRL